MFGSSRRVSLFVWSACFAVLSCTPAARGQTVRNEKFRTSQTPIPNQYIVVLTDDLGASVSEVAADLARQEGGTITHSYQYALKGFALKTTEAAARAISLDPRVRYVEEDGQVSGVTTQFNPPSWGLDRIDQRNLPLDNSYSYTNTGDGVTVYMIDSGIRFTHQDFTGRVSMGIDTVGDGQNGNDCNGHGTFTSGVAGGTSYGVAKGVSIVVVRVLRCDNTGFNSDLIAGLDWVTQNAAKPAVANVSILSNSPSESLDTAVRNSVASGITYTLAAGNSNIDAGGVSPARVTQAMTVGATDISDNRASFSNFGSVLDLFAPGDSVGSDWNTSDTASTGGSGTSFSAPHVAGVAAQYLETNASDTPDQVAAAITGNATTGVVINPGTGSPNRLLFSNFGMGVSLRPTSDVDNPVGGPGTSCPMLFDNRLVGNLYFASSSMLQSYDSTQISPSTMEVFPAQQNYRVWSQRKFSGWAAASGYSLLKLRVKSSCSMRVQNHAGCSVQYSLNNAATWNTIYSLLTDRPLTTDTVTLSATQDLTQLQIRVCGLSTMMSPTAQDPDTYSPVTFPVYDIRVDAR